MTSFSTYFHTLKYLKFSQLGHRVLRKVFHPKVRQLILERANANANWLVIELHPEKIFDTNSVCFLNRSAKLSFPKDWNSEHQTKLWLYNLHYFDDLNASGAGSKSSLHTHWIERWIIDNPAPNGNGWEPYPISLRIVNWIKSFLGNIQPTDSMLISLAQQADFLSQDLEKHLLGNHYFVNLKALIFAGCYFNGEDADKWLKIGVEGYVKELNEQVLTDGGNFELTPMYHAIMLVDLLDLINLFQTFPSKVDLNIVEHTKEIANKMFFWLDAMSLGDDKVSFFNDSTFGIAPENSVIRDYAEKLGLEVSQFLRQNKIELFDLVDSGYVSVKSNELTFIADLASIGPDYIPGHAHADSLSFEMSLGTQRVFVNSGISEYGLSAERLRQRGTYTHNTVVIDGQNSSEIWSGFRVARRANIQERVVKQDLNGVFISGTHNGYQKQGIKCLHQRSWRLSEQRCIIHDSLGGRWKSAVGHLYLHPEVEVKNQTQEQCLLLVNGYQVKVVCSGATLKVEESTWHPEFGKILSNQRLVFNYAQAKVSTIISWEKI